MQRQGFTVFDAEGVSAARDHRRTALTHAVLDMKLEDNGLDIVPAIQEKSPDCRIAADRFQEYCDGCCGGQGRCHGLPAETS